MRSIYSFPRAIGSRYAEICVIPAIRSPWVLIDYDKYDMQRSMWGSRSERMADRIRKAKNVS
jgi:hypothetical protein